MTILHKFPQLRQLIRCGLSLAALLAMTASSVWAEDILRPEEAFRYTTSVEGDEIKVEWTIEPGHYLYRERMSVRGNTDGVTLGEAIFPKGESHWDEYFGDMEIYRGTAVVRVPIISRTGGKTATDLELRLQGCADFGLCYPPQKWMTTVALAEESDSGTGGLSALLGAKRASNSDEPLPPEQAFRPFVELIDPFNLRISWIIADGYYLYRDSIAVDSDAPGIQLGEPLLPPGTPETDEYFGETQVFYSEVAAALPLSRATPDPMSLDLLVGFRGCKKDSICYAPQTAQLTIDLPRATADDQPRATAGPPQSEQDRLFAMIAHGNLIPVLAAFMGFGLLLAFTPCVLPMVPILSGIIAGQGKDITTGRAFLLSLSYVIGMSLTYSIAGALFAAAGQQVQAVFQEPWIIGLVAALFVALAMAMFGLYELQLPAALQTRLTAAGNRQSAGGFFGIALMGALSALVVSACVAPPLVAALAVVAETGDVVRGALALFALSLGMGVPLLIVGTSAGKLLPKAGAWMDSVKGAFGFIMLGLAVWMLDRILPGIVVMGLWALLVFMAGVFLGAFQSLPDDARAIRKLSKGFGVLATVYGITLLIGALSGASNPLQPLSRIVGSTQVATEMQFKQIKSIGDLDTELMQAALSNQPVMLDFWAEWCVSCKEMEHFTFSDPRVQSQLSNAVLLQADVTANDDIDQALMQRFGIFGPPTIVFFNRNGAEIRSGRVIGYMEADEFIDHVKTVID